MARKTAMRWLAAGGLILAVSACDAVNDRLSQLGELTNSVMEQMGGGEGAPPPVEDLLAAAPLEARALFGVMQAPVEDTPVSLEEAIQTQSYFVVGSVIAKPKAEISEPVVEPESFDLEMATASAPAQAEPAPAEAPLPPPAAMSAPEAAAEAESIEIAPRPILRAQTPMQMRRQAEISPKLLERDIAKSGVPITEESVRKGREAAEEVKAADSQTAQRIGDEVVRKMRDVAAPVPKELAIRSKLDVEAALTVRQRAYSKLEQMGLSGVVSPEEGGVMKIEIGVAPTRFPPKLELERVDSMRARVAMKRDNLGDECEQANARARMQTDPVLATECVVKALQETGDYEFVEKDYIFSNQLLRKPKTATQTAIGVKPNDPLFGLQWHFKDQGTGAGLSPGGAGFGSFWTRAKLTGSKSVTVAVIDTGLQLNHPDIAGSPNVVKGYDMVSDVMMGNDGDGRDANPHDPGDRCDPNDPTSSDTFHGTHVAGTIGAASTDNASGVAGGAWDVSIVPVRALGRCGGRLSDINDAIRWAAGTVPARDAGGAEIWNENPADIINLSIGLFEPCPASMQAAIDDAVAAGAIVVVAAGNARVDTKYFAPASCRNVIPVAASDARGMLTPYSNFGANVAIMAPGGDMTRDDDGDGRPDGVLSTKFSTNCYDPAKPGTQVTQCYYAYENGTSMAAPHVSAALALLKAKFPAAVPSELKSRLLAASTSRTALQCSGKCSNYPGTVAIPGQEGMCSRPCGGVMLNLGKAAVE
jgi:serine protease